MSGSYSTSGGINVGDLNSTSDDGSLALNNMSTIDSNISGDSCTWYSGGICSRPRSCFDCLNVAIYGQDCAVSAYGECMNSYMLSSIGGYSTSRFTYCSHNDTICSGCRENWISDYEAGVTVDTNAVCVGESDCICIAACVLPDRDENIVDNWCTPALEGTHLWVIALLVAGIIALFVVATVLTKRQLARRQRQDAANREARTAAQAALRASRRPPAVAHLPQLTLSGWTGMREKLVSSEIIRLARGSRATIPTVVNPSMEQASMEEQGDGYRQMSPTDATLRRV